MIRTCFTIGVILVVFCVAIAGNALALNVVVSFSIPGDMVSQVAGERVNLKTLVGPDGNVHEYEPTPADVRAISAADLVFINGLGLEGWIERLIHSSGFKGKVVTLTSHISVLKSNGAHVENDPHAWQSLADGKIYVMNIRDALDEEDAVNKSFYDANAASYMQKLGELDDWVRKEIATVEPRKRKVICMHDSFRYFAKEYGVEMVGLMGVSTESQPSAADVAHIIDLIRQQDIKAVFLENMSDSRLIGQLEKDGGAYIGGTLYSDALSPPSGPAPHYTDMFRHNVAELVKAMKQQR